MTALTLGNAALLRTGAYIDGRWDDAGSGTFDVHNPATGALVGSVARHGAAAASRAVEAATTAQVAWAARSAGDRAVILRRWHDLMLANADDLARLMTAEQGKPLAEARGEIAYAASFLLWFAEEARRVYGMVTPATRPPGA